MFVSLSPFLPRSLFPLLMFKPITSAVGIAGTDSLLPFYSLKSKVNSNLTLIAEYLSCGALLFISSLEKSIHSFFLYCEHTSVPLGGKEYRLSFTVMVFISGLYTIFISE